MLGGGGVGDAGQRENTKQAFQSLLGWPPREHSETAFSFHSVHVLVKTCIPLSHLSLLGPAAFMGRCLEVNPLPILSPVWLSLKS